MSPRHTGMETAHEVRDLMTEVVEVARPGDSLAEVRERMDEHRCRHMPVVDGEGDLVGLVTHRDLLRYALIEQPEVPRFVETALLERLTVGDVMVREVETVDPGAELRQAAQTMIENKFGCLPVVEGRRLVGILTESDFVRRVAQGA